MIREPLEPAERLFLRSRMVPALGLALVVLLGAAWTGFQALAQPEHRFWWWAGTILLLGLGFGVGRVAFRISKDLRNNAKVVREGIVQEKSPSDGPAFLVVDGETLPVSKEVWQQSKKGHRIQFAQTPGGISLGLRFPDLPGE